MHIIAVLEHCSFSIYWFSILVLIFSVFLRLACPCAFLNKYRQKNKQKKIRKWQSQGVYPETVRTIGIFLQHMAFSPPQCHAPLASEITTAKHQSNSLSWALSRVQMLSFQLVHVCVRACVCKHMQFDTAAEQRKVKETKQQQCPPHAEQMCLQSHFNRRTGKGLKFVSLFECL